MRAHAIFFLLGRALRSMPSVLLHPQTQVSPLEDIAVDLSQCPEIDDSIVVDPSGMGGGAAGVGTIPNVSNTGMVPDAGKAPDTANTQYIRNIYVLTVGVVIGVAVVAVCCLCGCCVLYTKKKRIEQDDDKTMDAEMVILDLLTRPTLNT
jgi:hypothetical protein